jgi:hypothetical protein
MSKIKILLIALASVLVAIGAWVIIQKQSEKKIAVSLPVKGNVKEIPVDPLKKINQVVDLFEQKPSLLSLVNVENAIRESLPKIDMGQRYELLDRWKKVLTPRVNQLDIQQDGILEVFEGMETTLVAEESAKDAEKRVEAELMSKLNPAQKYLFKQLIDHHIGILLLEEPGSVYYLKAQYWKSLFAPFLLKDDQIYWDEVELKTDPLSEFTAGVGVNRLTLGDWAFSWEQYIKRYPKSHYQKEAKKNYEQYLLSLLTGLLSEPIVDSETNTLFPDAEKDFDSIVGKYPNSNVARSITIFRKKLYEAEENVGVQVNLEKLAQSAIALGHHGDH